MGVRPRVTALPLRPGSRSPCCSSLGFLQCCWRPRPRPFRTGGQRPGWEGPTAQQGSPRPSKGGRQVYPPMGTVESGMAPALLEGPRDPAPGLCGPRPCGLCTFSSRVYVSVFVRTLRGSRAEGSWRPEMAPVCRITSTLCRAPALSGTAWQPGSPALGIPTTPASEPGSCGGRRSGPRRERRRACWETRRRSLREAM